MSSTQPLLFGTTEECFRDFRNRYDARPLYRTLTQFCGVRTETIARWFKATANIGAGHSLIGLRCFLSLAGYQVKELDDLDEVRRDLAYLIAFEAVPLNQVGEELGMPASDLSQLWRILNNGVDLVGKRLESAQALIAQHRSKIDADAMKRWRLFINAKVIAPATPRTTAPVVNPKPEVVASALVKNIPTVLTMYLDSTNTLVETLIAALVDGGLDPQTISAATRDGAMLQALIDNLDELQTAATPASSEG